MDEAGAGPPSGERHVEGGHELGAQVTGHRPAHDTGDAFDNALAESFFASLESELIDRTSWVTQAQARAAVFEYIEVFYDRQGRHSALGYLSPEEFERRYRPADTPAA
jgi:hypothetical protein